MYTAIILVAGSGKRMNAGINKMLLEVKGKPLYEYTLNSFLKFNIPIILVVSKNDYDLIKNRHPELCVVTGGETREESVRNALEYVKTDRVLIHDGARVLVSDEIISKCLNSKSDAFYVAIPLKDTIRRKSDSFTLKRDEYVAVQTPQGGKLEYFKSNILKATTDDISALDDLNLNIEIIDGDDYNFKVTTAFDYDVVSSILGGQND